MFRVTETEKSESADRGSDTEVRVITSSWISLELGLKATPSPLP